MEITRSFLLNNVLNTADTKPFLLL